MNKASVTDSTWVGSVDEFVREFDICATGKGLLSDREYFRATVLILCEIIDAANRKLPNHAPMLTNS